MKAVAVFPGEKQVRVIDHAEPEISRPNEIKLKILEVGVCGTDRDLVAFEYGSAPAGADYLILGHEGLAEVVEIGDSVTGMQRGDLVVPIVRHPCSHCLPCAAGRQDHCATGDYRERGIKDMHGFMTEFVIDVDAAVHVVPSALREVAVLIEPLTIAEKTFLAWQAIQQRLPWDKEGATAVVLGSGPVGLLGAMVLVKSGVRTFVYSRSREPNQKAAIARQVGCEYVSSQDVSPTQLRALTGPIDFVYEAAGAPPIAFELFQALGPNGVFACTGVPRQADLTRVGTRSLLLPLVSRNQVLLGLVNAGPDAFARAIADLEAFDSRWPAALRALITGRYAIEEFRRTVCESFGIKNLITFET